MFSMRCYIGAAHQKWLTIVTEKVQVIFNIYSCRDIAVLWSEKIWNEALSRRPDQIPLDVLARGRNCQLIGHV